MPILRIASIAGCWIAFAVPLAWAQPDDGNHAYRALRDGVRQGRVDAVEISTRVAGVIAEGRYALDLTGADLAQRRVPPDYPIVVLAGGLRLTARVVTPEQAQLRDREARERRAGVPVSDEVRLVNSASTGGAWAARVELDAWSGGQLLPLDLRPGDAVTILSVQPLRKGR